MFNSKILRAMKKMKLVIAIVAVSIGFSGLWIFDTIASGTSEPDETVNLLRITCPRDARLKSFSISEPNFQAVMNSNTMSISSTFYNGFVWVTILNRNNSAVYSRTFNLISPSVIHVDISNLPTGNYRLQVDTQAGLFIGAFRLDRYELL